jgi:hypothetical protein
MMFWVSVFGALGRFQSRAQLPNRSDLLQAVGYELLEGERIQTSFLLLQTLLGFGGDLRAGQDPGQRRLRLALNALETSRDAWALCAGPVPMGEIR